MSDNTDVRTLPVGNCARCGEDHQEVAFHRFKHPAGEWTSWATCPTTNEPILLMDIDDGPEPEAGSRWCHYKGGHYEVICVATHTEISERMVVYKSIDDDSRVWTRPLSMWHEDVGGRPRFQKEPNHAD